MNRDEAFWHFREKSFMAAVRWILPCCLMWANLGCLDSKDPLQTTLTDEWLRYRVPERPYVILERGPVQAVIVNNEPVNDGMLPGHLEGYSGVASLRYDDGPNLFVNKYAGLNFEHIHSGTNWGREVLFEPRHHPMQVRVIDRHTVELYQEPTPHWKVESVHRYHLLPDGTIEMTFVCIPREATFENGYMGLFWASYIERPKEMGILFKGMREGEALSDARRLYTTTPSHGVEAMHPAWNDRRTFTYDPDFALTLVFNRSGYVYSEPWFFGVSKGLAFAQMFDADDQIRFSQSPSGGGEGCPAWDFQYLVPDVEIGRRYGFKMRARLMPYDTFDQVIEDTAMHRKALNASRSPDASRSPNQG